MNKKKLSVKMNFDQLLTAWEEKSERFLEVAVQASKADELYQRPSLNLALVIDRSGSMAGDKLEFVKKASNHVVNLLNEKDRVALVDYDEQVRIEFPSTLLDAESKPVLQQRIASIHSGGMTNLCDGWLTGCQQIAEVSDPALFTHALLLTDGLANVGITDHTELATHARELARRGVSTSTFGVGRDYDQNLLEEMANQGEGLFRFIEGPSDIPEIFKGVFKELLSIIAHEVEVTLSYPKEVQVSLLGDWRFECPDKGRLRVYLGSLSAGRSRELYIKLTIPPGKENTEIPLKINFKAKDENGSLIELESVASVRQVNKAESDTALKDAALMERFAYAEVGDRASDALKLEKEGKRKEASELLDKILLTHHKFINSETHSHYRSMSQRMVHGMDELDRKRSHNDAYMQKKYMSERYPFRLIPNARGLLVFNYQGQATFLDTGSPVSFGRENHWDFLGWQLTLPPSFMKISPDSLSQDMGITIDLIMGMDVLKDLYFQINTREMVITFSEYKFRSTPFSLRLETIEDVPGTEIFMNKEMHKVYVDSGAKINYLRKDALAGLEPVETQMEFHPMMGEFGTKVYQVPVNLFGETHMMRCGVLPPPLETILSDAGVEGILGIELFDKYVVSFERGTQRLYLERYEV